MTAHITGHDILHFSHANGFPAGSYRVLTERLSAHYDVRTIDRLAHQPDYPVTDNWPSLAHELKHYFERHYHQPVIAVGHSLGGVLSYMVAQQRPDLVRAVVMLDSPMLTPMQTFGFRILKRLGMSDRVTPAGRTEGRRSQWSSQEEALAYFSGKSLMKQFDPRCLKDYVSAGTELIDPDQPEKGVQLRFDPEIEMKIYRTIPHNVRSDVPLAVPAAVIGGKSSQVFLPMNGARMQSKTGMKVKWLPGGHMFPLEHPETTADLIHQLLAEML
ncbi:alpha/beta fold hydrolase [Bacterioplanoides sp.]|uniref:alpha/beta fold hydrolase n=1 Tax=Bacterioplanoides sp. TaxID=2066072 RepID=UPI003AFFEAB8